jgi:hypothetical protein
MTDAGHPTQKPPVISEWVGYWVFVSYISGPNLDTEEPAKPVRDRPEAVTASFLLEDYGELGIEVKRNLADPTIFMSWGAVLYVQGPPPKVREQIDREAAKQARGGDGE